MKITPHINKLFNFVKLDIDLKNGEIENRSLPSAVQSQAFATLDRTAKTSVVVADSDTVVIGGLIRDSVSDNVTKIPLLGDIPILGWLFKSTQKQVQKSNLIVFMTPHVVRQYEKVRSILDKKLKERDEFIEQNMGGDDALRYQRDDIIRGLPDLKQLEKSKPQTTVTIDEDQAPAAVEVTPGNPFTGGETEQQRPAGGNAPSATAPGVDTPPPPPAPGNP
jgi:general secretion pathway protein D